MNRNIRKFKLRNTLTKSSVSDVPSSPEALKDLFESSSGVNVPSPLKSSTTVEAVNIDEIQSETSTVDKPASASNETVPSTRYILYLIRKKFWFLFSLNVYIRQNFTESF